MLDLTFKEFELLKFLAQHPGRVFTRAQLLQEVWGYDYYGGTRTVDVHVRRLRAKLGPEHETLIGTVRNVGYRFVVQRPEAGAAERVRRGRRLSPPRRTSLGAVSAQEPAEGSRVEVLQRLDPGRARRGRGRWSSGPPRPTASGRCPST